MAQLYGISGSTGQEQCPPQLGFIVVQCPNCTSHFCLPQTFIYPQRLSPNVTYSQGSNFQYTQPFIQHPSPGSGRSTFYPPIPFSCYAFGVNQQHQEMTNDPNIRQYVSQHAVDMNNMIVRRIRDILIEILNSAMCEYGVTVCQLMALLKQSCTNYNIILPSSIMNGFKEFLRYKMTDYVEIEDDLCRYRHPLLSIQEESISSSSVCERTSNCSKTSSAAVVPWQALQRCDITSAIAANASYSTDEVEKVMSKKEEIKGTIIYRSAEEPSFSFAKFRDNKSKLFFGGIKEHHRNDDVDKTTVIDPVVPDEDRGCNALCRVVKSNAISEIPYTKSYLTKTMEKWKEIFIGDLKELIRYLRMVDDYFQKNDGKFNLSEFKEVFGELNKRWEFCDIDLIEMGIINVVHGIGLNEEPVLIVNPIVREVEFPELAELAVEIYNLLSKLLQSVNSVKIEVIVRIVNFGINNRKTIDEKYALLWEVLSDSQFQDVFIVDVLQKQNKERGFDVMVRLNPNLDLSGIFTD